MNNNHISKRKRQAILFFTYGCMALATVVISAVCLLLVLGFRFNIVDGKLEQGGLLQFRSQPATAAVTVDGVKQSFTTPGKLEVSAGTHTVTMQKANYKTWQKTTTIAAGELTWLNYARLIPETITTKALTSVDGVTSALASPDHKYLAVVLSSKPQNIVIYDLSNIPTVTSKTITLPDALLTKQADQASSLAFSEWDTSSHYLLLVHTSGTTHEYIRIDRTQSTGAPYNLTKEFNLPFASAHFSGTGGAQLYALTDHDIRRIDTSAKSVSQPLVTGVDSYRLYRENDIAFTAIRTDKKVAGVYIDGKETVIRRFAASEPVYVDLTEYYSHQYLGIASHTQLEVIKDPTTHVDTAGRTFASLTLPYDVSWLDFASSGRFVIAGSGLAYTLYDLEKDDHFSVNGDQTALPMAPNWLDDFYLVDNPSGMVRMYEYDGANEHDIVSADTSLPIFLSNNGTYLMSFDRHSDALQLQASRLILE